MILAHRFIMLRYLMLTAALIAVAACQPTLTAAPNPTADSVEDVIEDDVAPAAQAAAGLNVAEARCAACHAVTPDQVSANSDAPTFASIARRPGLTQATAYRWLRNSHDFPDQMNFNLDPEQAEQLAAYLLTLRDQDSD